MQYALTVCLRVRRNVTQDSRAFHPTHPFRSACLTGPTRHDSYSEAMSPRILPRSVRVTSSLFVLVLGSSLSMQAFSMSTVPALIMSTSVVFCTLLVSAVLLSPEVQASFGRRRLAAQVKAGYAHVAHQVRSAGRPDEEHERYVAPDEIESLLLPVRPEIDEAIISPRAPRFGQVRKSA